jgi:hypothetical protein
MKQRLVSSRKDNNLTTPEVDWPRPLTPSQGVASLASGATVSELFP